MKYVLITTKHRGVFAGELKEQDDDAKRVILKKARCAIYWATKGGFLELAKTGPVKGSKIGSEAPEVVFHDVTSIADCTKEAKSAWQAANDG